MMKKRSAAVLFFATSAALMVIALYNGYPLVERTTGRYIGQAFAHGGLPFDDTPFYGLFIRISSLCASLWFTVTAQCMLLSFLLLRYIAGIRGGKNDIRYDLPAVIGIVSFTCVGWVSAYILPVVFGGILLLAILLFLSDKTMEKRHLLLYASIILFSVSQYISYFITIFIFALVILVCSLLRKRKAMMMRSLVLMGISAAFWLVMCSINKRNGYDFNYLRGKQVLMMARLSEDGILDTYFKENKNSGFYKLNTYRDSLPADAEQFLWAGNSPLACMGGWEGSHDEYSMLVHELFKDPSYIYMYAQRSVTGTFTQLARLQAPEFVVNRKKGTDTYNKMEAYFADEVPEYATSLQNDNEISTGLCNYVYNSFFIISCIWVLFLGRAALTDGITRAYKLIFLFLVVNAFVTASLFISSYKFQYSVFWILPATNIIVLIRHYLSKYSIKDDSGPQQTAS